MRESQSKGDFAKSASPSFLTRLSIAWAGQRKVVPIFIELVVAVQLQVTSFIQTPEVRKPSQIEYLEKPLITETKITKSVIGSTSKQNHFPWGWCTYGVAQWVDVTWRGNAKDWLRNAELQGYQTGDEPIEGSIVVTNDDPQLGHVALVIKVEGDYLQLREMNYRGFGVVSERKLSKYSGSIRGYIYWKEVI